MTAIFAVRTIAAAEEDDDDDEKLALARILPCKIHAFHEIRSWREGTKEGRGINKTQFAAATQITLQDWNTNAIRVLSLMSWGGLEKTLEVKVFRHAILIIRGEFRGKDKWKDILRPGDNNIVRTVCPTYLEFPLKLRNLTLRFCGLAMRQRSQ